MTQNIESIITLLTPIFRDVFDDEDLVIEETTTADSVDGWDSLAHIRLIVSIETKLGLRFSTIEISGLANVGAMAELILVKKDNG